MTSPFDVVVVRRAMLNEEYGAHLWKTLTGAEVLTTDPVVKMTESYLEQITGKRVLLVGGYYRDNMDPIVERAKSVFIFFNTSDDVQPNSECVIAKEGVGFLMWTVKKLNIVDVVTNHIAQYLDEYLYGYPSDESLCFQNGVYVIQQPTEVEKILTVKTEDDITRVLEQGRIKRINNLRIAIIRLGNATEIAFTLRGVSHSALVVIGDTPIVDTCLLLAEKSQGGLGIMFRYDLEKKRTMISARATKESGIDAGQLMKALVKGGGSKPMGGGSVDELVFPGDFFRRFG